MIKFLKNIIQQPKIYIIFILIFIIITFPKMLTHYPCGDESQNFMVSYFMNCGNWIDLISMHGHPLIWYLIIMPFAKYNIGYPYSILILNYIFILSALIIMWKKAPFENIYKIIITFSYMMINYYAIIARCYSIGILGLFIIAALWKEQHKKSLLYAVLLGITANTSAIAAITIIPLAFIFIYNLFKEYKNINKIKFISAIFILFFFAFILIIPFLLTSTYNYSPNEMFFFISGLKSFFLPVKYSLLFIFSYLFVIFYLLYYSKNLQSKFFLISATSLLWIFMFFIYKCFPYHRFFFFIFIILTMWIQNYDSKYKKNAYILIISLIMILYTPYNLIPWNGQKYTYEFGNTLKNSPLKYNNSIVVIPDYYIRYEIAPYLLLNNPTAEIFGCEHFYDYKFTDGENCDYIPSVSKLIKDSNKPIYLFSNKNISEYKLIEENKGMQIYKLK